MKTPRFRAGRYLPVALSLLLVSTGGAAVGKAPATTSSADPVKGTTTGFWQELHTPAAPRPGKPRSGEQVYRHRCRGCHGRNTQGAPLPGDRDEWGRRAEQGMDVLMRHAIEGYKATLMPLRGGCKDCSDAEIEAAVRYMMNAEPDAGLKQLPRSE